VADIVAAAVAGDEAAMRGLRTVGDWLGIGVVNLVNIFNPDVVVFGGTLREILPLVRDSVQAELSGSLTAPGDHVLLALPALGDDSTLLGAAETAFVPLLDDPLGVVSAPKRRGRTRATA
jgi:predicted NBD/HSP70 family sugar kinase